MGPIETRLREKLAVLAPNHLAVTNESHLHGRPPGTESHFRVVVVSEAFASDSRLERHRRVNALVAEELLDHVHALGLQAFTPAEWTARGGETFPSPDCRGGSKSTTK